LKNRIRYLREVKLRSSCASAVARREDRLPRFLDMPDDAHDRLDQLNVAIVGVGSVGRNAALHLARLQIAGLLLIDCGRLKAQSVLTHLISPADVSQPKASNAGRVCKRVSPDTRVMVSDGTVQELPLTAFAGVDVIFLATDNLLAESEVAQRAIWLGKPLIQASVHGATLVGQVRCFSNRDGQGACPVCSFSEVEWNHLNLQTRFNCDGPPMGKAAAEITKEPTMSTSFLCSTAADLALVQILRYVLGLGAPVMDTMLEYCGYTHRTVVSPLVRNPECRCDHTTYERAPCPRPVPDCTLRQFASLAGFDGEELLSFRVDEMTYAELGACGCGGSRPLRRFVADGAHVGRCRSCGAPVFPRPSDSHRPVPRSVVADVLDRPLRDLGAGAAQWLAVRCGDRAVLFIGPENGQKGA